MKSELNEKEKRDHEEFMFKLYSVTEPLKEAYATALRNGVRRDALAVAMTGSLFYDIQADVAIEVRDQSAYSLLFGGELLKGASKDCSARIMGMPIIVVPSYNDHAKRCWLMQEIELIPKKGDEDG